MLISFAVTAKLICAFVFAYAQIVGFSMWLIILILHYVIYEYSVRVETQQNLQIQDNEQLTP